MIVDIEGGGSAVETATKNPGHHNRVLWTWARNNNVDVETIFREFSVGVPHSGAGEVAEHRINDLNTRVWWFCGIKDALPLLDWTRMTETQGADGRLSIWDAEPCIHLPSCRRCQCQASHLTLVCRHYQRITFFGVYVRRKERTVSHRWASICDGTYRDWIRGVCDVSLKSK